MTANNLHRTLKITLSLHIKEILNSRDPVFLNLQKLLRTDQQPVPPIQTNNKMTTTTKTKPNGWWTIYVTKVPQVLLKSQHRKNQPEIDQKSSDDPHR